MTGLYPRRYASAEEVLNDIRRVAQKLNQPDLSLPDYRRHGGRYGAETIRIRFGSFTIAKAEAGLTPAPHHHNISNQTLLRDLKRVARRLHRSTLTGKQYDKHGTYSAATLAKRFGCWASALLRAGLKPTAEQIAHSRTIGQTLRAISSLPGLTTEDRIEVAKTIDELRGLDDELLLRYFVRMNAGPMELPTGTPSDGVALWEQCMEKLAKAQPNQERLAKTRVLKRLGHQIHRAVAIELLGREPLSPTEERRVLAELRRRRQATA